MIPFNIHGVVDVDGVGISDRDLMGHAFINSIAEARDHGTDRQAETTERYAY